MYTEADWVAVWIPVHTRSNPTEEAEKVFAFVMTVKELDFDRSKRLVPSRITICDVFKTSADLYK